MATILCPNCGHREKLGAAPARRKVRCPQCGVLCPVEDSEPAKHGVADQDEERALQMLDEVEPPPPKKPPRPAPAPPKVSSHEDDGTPYVVTGGEEKRCPECRHVIDDDAVLCIHCGLDLRQGKKAVRTYEPLQYTWDLGLHADTRWKLFVALTLLGVVLSVVMTAVAERVWYDFLLPSFLVALLLVVLLGTYFRAEVTRDKKGRVKLTRAWRFAFWPRAPQRVDLVELEGVRNDVVRDAGLLEWLLCVYLLFYGIVPGVLWWWYIIHKDRWIVVLTRDHGRGVELLYRGNDGALAKEVTATLRDAARLREETS